MDKQDNIFLRARNFDLTESELEALHTNTNAIEEVYDAALAQVITEELFIPGHKALLDEKRIEIINLPKDGLLLAQQRPTIYLKVISLVAIIVLFIGLFFILRPSTDISSDQQMVQFRKISSSRYSPEAIAAIERSSQIATDRDLVQAYIHNEYDIILMETNENLETAELQLLRARVLMNINRYEEANTIMAAINQEELVQKNVYFWMKAEGALGIGDHKSFESVKKYIINNKLPGFQDLKSI